MDRLEPPQKTKIVIDYPDGRFGIHGKILTALEFEKLKQLMRMRFKMIYIHLQPDEE